MSREPELQARVKVLDTHVDRMLDGVMRIIGERNEARHQVEELVKALIARRAMEPRHSHPDHACPECTLLAEVRRASETWNSRPDRA